MNNLTWGLDHMIYGAAAGNGGTIRPASAPEAAGVSVEHNDFRFDPVTASFEPISGSDQFGNTFDDWGNRFICDESHPLSQPVLAAARAGAKPAAGGSLGRAGHRRGLGADFPDQPDRSAGGRFARAAGSRMALDRPNRPGPAITSSTPAPA